MSKTDLNHPSHDFKRLDVRELSAVHRILPTKFKNDPDGKKNEWRDLITKRLMDLTGFDADLEEENVVEDEDEKKVIPQSDEDEKKKEGKNQSSSTFLPSSHIYDETYLNINDNEFGPFPYLEEEKEDLLSIFSNLTNPNSSSVLFYHQFPSLDFIRFY